MIEGPASVFRVGTTYGLLYVEAAIYEVLDGDHLEFTDPEGGVVALISSRNWYLVTQVLRSAVPAGADIVTLA